MRIVYYAHSVLSRGGDKAVLNHLGELAAAGHRVEIVTNVVSTVFTVGAGIRLRRISLPTKLGTLLMAVSRFPEADLIIATIVPTAVLLALRNSGKVVFFAQDDNVSAYRSRVSRVLVHCLYQLCFRVLAIPTIAVSPQLAAAFGDRYGADCQVVANGVDTANFYPEPSAQLISDKADRKALLLFGRADTRKGFDLSRHVVMQLAGLSVHFEVWIVGERMQWQDCPVPLRQFGMVGEPELRAIMSSADVMLYPSRSEGFPLMVLEALACRCPVVATEAVSFLNHGSTALLSAIGDVQSLTRQVLRMFEDPDLAKRLADTGYDYARQNSQATASRRFAEAIGHLSAAPEGMP